MPYPNLREEAKKDKTNAREKQEFQPVVAPDSTVTQVRPKTPEDLSSRKRQVVETKAVEDIPHPSETLFQQFEELDIVQKFLSYMKYAKGKKLRPSEVLPNFLKYVKEVESTLEEGDISRKEEVIFAYRFLEYLYFLYTKKVQFAPTHEMTQFSLSLIRRINQLTSDDLNYIREKLINWGRRVNRPNRNEEQEIKDFILNSSLASHLEILDFHGEGYELANLSVEDRNLTISKTALEVMRDMIIERNAEVAQVPVGDELMLPFAGIAKKDRYTVLLKVGSRVKKIEVPAYIIEQNKTMEFHVLFYRECFTTEKSANGYFWFDRNSKDIQRQMKKGKTLGDSGKENIAQAKIRRKNMGDPDKGILPDMTAADFCFSFCSAQEFEINNLQQDERTSTYGPAIPTTVTFGIDEEGNLLGFATNNAHAYTDGGELVKRMKKITSNVFGYLMKHAPTTHEKGVPQPQVLEAQKEAAEKNPLVWETALPREKYAHRINAVREAFKNHPVLKEFGININMLELWVISLCITEDLDHGHFLEAVYKKEKTNDDPPKIIKKQIGLNAAPFIVQPDLRRRIKARFFRDRNDEYYLELFSSLIVMQLSRKLTQEGMGPANILDALLNNRNLSKAMQAAGTFFDNLKTSFLTNTILFSFLAGGYKPMENGNEFFRLRGFTTASAETYYKGNGVIGGCDRKNPETGEDEIYTTLRQIVSDPQKGNKLKDAERYFERILSDLEHIAKNADKYFKTQPEKKNRLFSLKRWFG